MERIQRPNGSQFNFETTITSLQEKAFSNLKKRVSSLISQ
jgi:hypothetical protein